MLKHYKGKSALFLSLLLAAASTQAVAAEETTTPTSVENTVAAPAESTVAPAETGVTQPEAPMTTPAEGETAVVAPVEGQTVDVRILSTTDLHTNLVNYDYYQDKTSQNLGLAKTAVLIKEAKAENPNVVLVDNGDTIQGTPLGTYKAIVDPVEKGEQHPMFAALKSLGFDAGTLGNHEFNYGLDYLDKIIQTAGMPLLNANVLDAKSLKPLYKTYDILPKTFTDTTGKQVTVNIGITGIVPPQILNWDKAHLEGKIIVKDAVKALEELVPTIRQAGADIVLVLSHSGIGDDKYEEGEENVGYQIAGIKGVDAVVTGHSHAEFPSKDGKGFYEKFAGVNGAEGKINGTPVTMAGKYGDHLGVIDLGLTFQNGKWQVTKSKASIRKIDTKSDKADETILTLAKDAHEGTVAYVRKQVGTTTAPINSFFALVKDDPSVQIVNNAQIWYAKQELAGTPEANLPILSAAAPFKAGTRGDATAYTDIPTGSVAIKNVADLYLYDNVTAILKVTGTDLREWLEMAAGQFKQVDPASKEPQNIINPEYRTYNFDVIDGVTYKFDITQPNKYDIKGNLVNDKASRVRDLMYMGKAVDDNQEFIVVTNNYRANGTFPGVKNASLNRLLNLENRQAIINYIVAEKTINPSADNNWYFTDSIKNLDLRFMTADRAKALVEQFKDITYLEASKTDGFGDFRFTYVEPVKVETPAPKPMVPATPAPKPSENKPMTDEKRQEIFDMVKEAYQETKEMSSEPKMPLATPVMPKAEMMAMSAPAATKASQVSEKALPKTNAKESTLLSLIGLSVFGFIPVLNKKRNRN